MNRGFKSYGFGRGDASREAASRAKMRQVGVSFVAMRPLSCSRIPT